VNPPDTSSVARPAALAASISSFAPGLKRGVGDLVHALDADERGVHVERDELVVGQAQRRRDALHDEAGGEFGGGGVGGHMLLKR
jgi:hypothetical protein